MNNELKPCPFCGSLFSEFDPNIHAYYGVKPEFSEKVHKSNSVSPHEQRYVIRCNKCEYELTPEQWNTRPVEDALRKELEELKESIKNIDRAYKWYNEDTYENCISVVSDAIYFAMEKIERIESK